MQATAAAAAAPVWRRIPKVEAILSIFLFVAAILLPVAKQFIFGEPPTQSQEGRPLAPTPIFQLTADALDIFPAKFADYYGDHFGLRAKLLSLGNFLKVKYLQASPSQYAVVGKSGWLYSSGDGAEPRFNGTAIFKQLQLESWRLAIERKQKWCEQRGIKYLLVAAPDKETIYPEFVPSRFGLSHTPSPLDQLMRYLSASGNDLPVLDLRVALFDAKKREQVYYRGDSHWNHLGAFVGYTQIMDQLAQWFPDLKPEPRSHFQIVTSPRRGDDLERMIGIPDYTSDTEYMFAPAPGAQSKKTVVDIPGVVPLTEVQHPFLMETPPSSSGQPTLKAVVVRDSFTIALIPFLSEHFSRALYLWRPLVVDAQFEKGVAGAIEAEHPDIVIEEIVERKILQLVPNDAVEQLAFGAESDAH